MIFEEKAEIVINQLRADRDRLLDAIEKIKAEIEELEEYLFDMNDTTGFASVVTCLEIIDKYAEQEPCEDDYQTDMDEAWKQAKSEPQESDEISERNMKMWEAIFKAESEPQESEDKG